MPRELLRPGGAQRSEKRWPKQAEKFMKLNEHTKMKGSLVIWVSLPEEIYDI